MSGFYGHFSVFEFEDGTHEIAVGVAEIETYRQQARMIPLNSHTELARTCGKPIKREIRGGWQPWNGRVVAQGNNGTTGADLGPYRDIVAAIFEAAYPTIDILISDFIRPHWGKHGDAQEWSYGMISMFDESVIPENVKAADQQRKAADQQWKTACQQWKTADQQWEAADQQWEAADQQRKAAGQQWEAAYQQWEAADQQWEAAGQQWEAAGQQWETAYQQWETADREWCIKTFLAHPNNYWEAKRHYPQEVEERASQP